jgi:hypothetical protein
MLLSPRYDSRLKGYGLIRIKDGEYLRDHGEWMLGGLLGGLPSFLRNDVTQNI